MNDKLSKPINILLPFGLLKQIDEAAKSCYASRSEYIRESVVLRLKNQHIASDTPQQNTIDTSKTWFELKVAD